MNVMLMWFCAASVATFTQLIGNTVRTELLLLEEAMTFISTLFFLSQTTEQYSRGELKAVCIYLPTTLL